ncbi:hypothetical protein [uncultured Capnocytophaga sp.]|uniref:hypothetical protein n=1 Tax=uncultured Capnocytophaga sp. TaxID=159273 RepID=UPI00261F7E83|nr:hypothetical protein [uncultured Capnocytophaga sp.]
MKKYKIFKALLLIVLFYWLYALYTTHIVYYSGYVYEGNKALSNVKIIEGDKNNYTYTNDKGYFKLRKKENVNNYLIFKKENYKTDSVFLTPMGGGFQGKVEYLFLRKTIDTLKIKKSN